VPTALEEQEELSQGVSAFCEPLEPVPTWPRAPAAAGARGAPATPAGVRIAIPILSGGSLRSPPA